MKYNLNALITVVCALLVLVHQANAENNLMKSDLRIVRTASNAMSTRSVSPNAVTGKPTTGIGIPYSPQVVRAVYGINNATPAANHGYGQMIAVIEVSDDPDIQTELDTFSKAYNLPSTKVWPAYIGGRVPANPTYRPEIALDIEWAHAMALYATMVVIYVPAPTLNYILQAIDFATNSLNASVVSLSYSTPEFSGETQYDSHFYTHPGTTFVAATGDTGGGGAQNYPAASPWVLAVGGTSLRFNAKNAVWTDYAWSGSTGGFSAYEGKPGYQLLPYVPGGATRAIPDLAFLADPASGASAYDKINGWYGVGGTSLSAPIAAGMMAQLKAGRASQNKNNSFLIQNVVYPVMNNLNAYLVMMTPIFAYDPIDGAQGRWPASGGYNLTTGMGRPNMGNWVNVLTGITP